MQHTNPDQAQGAAVAATTDPQQSADTRVNALMPADADSGTGEPQTPGEAEAPARRGQALDPAASPRASGEAELPPIEPPRSWTKEEKDRFASLPRATQDYLAQRETERDREFRRSQNEQAEARKAIEAERAQVVEARAQYEHALDVVLSHLQSAYASEFSDIKTMEDVERLAVEDRLRYTKWDAQQKRIAAVTQEIAAAQQRSAIEAQQRFYAFNHREAARFAELAPEMASEGTRKALMASAEAVLREVSFTDGELSALWHGELGLSIHDHRFQLILRNAVCWRDAQKATAELASMKPSLRLGLPAERVEQKTDNPTGMAAIRAAAALTAGRRRAG